MGEPMTRRPSPRSHLTARASVLLMLAAIVVLGLLPGLLFDVTDPAIQSVVAALGK